jgi:hypothetical protein
MNEEKHNIEKTWGIIVLIIIIWCTCHEQSNLSQANTRVRERPHAFE